MTSRIGPYALLDELGRGGMGVVYAAQHVELGRRVALKLLLSEHAAPETTQRFQIEAQALAQADHPNVVGIHEVGVDHGRPYLVMDLIEGESLQQRIKREGPLEPEAAVALCETLARAMEHAHQRAILHRDLKPANVLLATDGRAVITDFGLARQLGDERERLTRTGQTLGTPAFMPPEQVDGVDVDARADVYSLGATLYACLAGRPPFQGSTAINILTAVMTRPPEPLSTVRPGIDRDLETVCLKCLEKEPEDRYVSAGHLADDLARWREGGSVLAKRSRRSGQGRARAAAVVVLLAAAVGLVIVVNGSSPQPAGTHVASKSSAAPTPGAEVADAPPPTPTTGDPRLLRAPSRRFTACEEAIFLSESRILTAGTKTQLWSLDESALPLHTWPQINQCLTPAGPRGFLALQVGTLSWSHTDKPAQQIGQGLTELSALAVSPERGALAMSQANLVTVFALPTGKVACTFHALGSVQGLAWAANDSLVTLSGAEGTFTRNALELWRLPKTKSTEEPRRQGRSVDLAFSSSAIAIDRTTGLVVVANGSQLQVYRVQNNRIEQSAQPRFRGSETEVNDVLSSPAHGEHVADVAIAGARVYSVSKFELRVWSLKTGQELFVRKRDPPAMVRVDATPQGRVLLSGPEGAELWDLSQVLDPK